MRVHLLGPPFGKGKKTHVDFEVWADEHEPGFEDSLLCILNHDYKLSSTAEELAELVWEDALACKEKALLEEQYFRDVCAFLNQKMDAQGV